ncbi:MAG: GNAT family protein [Tissierellia bacterium]|nr:GNAT family protein [Tissierellia bacterium]
MIYFSIIIMKMYINTLIGMVLNLLKMQIELLEYGIKDFEEGWIIRFAITEKTTNRIIGTIFLNNFEGRRAEIGYELSEDHWQKGIMSEAMKEVLKLGFKQLKLTRIQAFVHEENIASKHLLKKFNFQEEGYLRLYECHEVSRECKNMYIYAVLKNEFSYF